MAQDLEIRGRFWSLPGFCLALLTAAAVLPTAAFAQGSTQTNEEAAPLSAEDSHRVTLTAAEGEIDIEILDVNTGFGDYLAGLVARRNRDLSAAADFMLKALESDPENLELLSLTFLLAAGDGRQTEALDLAERLAELQPENVMPQILRAIDATRREDFAKAEDILTALPDKGLGSLTGPLIYGWLEVARGDFAKAEERIAVLKETNGFEAIYTLHSALIKDVAGDVEAAAQGYEEALTGVGRATLRLSWISGNFYERQGQPDRALEIYQGFIEGNPGTTLLDPFVARARAGADAKPAVASAADGLAEVMFNMASLLTQERAEELALAHIQQALVLKEDFIVARVLLGEILQEQGRYREAIETYRKVPRDSAFSWMVRLRIAEQLEEIEAVDEALTELDSLAAERPDQFEPHFRKGNLLRAHERFEEAVVAYDAAAAKLEAIEQRHWSLLYFRGIAHERAGTWDLAEADFLKALELEPEQPFVMNYLAYSWVEQKLHLEEAKEMLVRAVDLRPTDGYIVDSLGWVYYRVGEYENAVTYLEQAVELRPQDPVINDHLGDAYWQTGRKNEARFQWRRSLSLEPEEDQIPIIKGKIKNGLDPEPKDI